MARDFTSNDAKQLIVQLNAVQNMQRELVNLPEQYRQDMAAQTRQMIAAEHLIIMCAMSSTAARTLPKACAELSG